ncbi:MAG: Rho termination factor N-terminal domain-containing protein [Actinomycetota bacterium]|nr:Rho termination factor N-terminal domain-containing protein [Actinomycetota bacterium]
MPNSSINDEEQYQALRREGESKEKAARIANASANSSRSATGHRGGEAGRYEERSKQDLYEKAKQVGIEGRSSMTKRELIDALRNH